MDDLVRLRDEIDKVDKELVRLFEKRMEIVSKVVDFKKRNKLPIYHKDREEEVIKKNIAYLRKDKYKQATTNFFNNIMSISKSEQEKKYFDEFEGLGHSFKDYKNGYKTKVIYQGVEGCFSEQALREYFGNEVRAINVKEFEDVFIELEKGRAEYGILPIENSSTGGISEVYNLLRKYGFYIVGEKCIKVEHNLMSIKGAELNNINEVYSHQQAFEQSKDFLKKYSKMKLIPYRNTAVSAKYVKEKNCKNKAAIASKRAAELYGLNILESNINHNMNNYTRFIVIGKEPEIDQNCDKISIIISVPHEPGALYEILKHFAQNNINMMKIESRPDNNESWKYVFYIDFKGNVKNNKIKKVIRSIKENSNYFKFLGNYKSN